MADLPVIGIDAGPIARLEHVKKQADTPGVVFHRLSNGETLKEIAKAWEVPAGPFVLWFTTTHAELYDAALKVLADEMAHDALEIADEQKEAIDKKGNKYDPEVPRDKLRVDTRMRLLEKWDRSRYGAKDVGVAGGITVVVDRSCGGAVSIQAGASTLTIAGGGVSKEVEVFSTDTRSLPAEKMEI
jgi:hypothetical protein